MLIVGRVLLMELSRDGGGTSEIKSLGFVLGSPIMRPNPGKREMFRISIHREFALKTNIKLGRRLHILWGFPLFSLANPPFTPLGVPYYAPYLVKIH